MYASCSCPRVEIYADPAHSGRYGIAMAGDLYADFSLLETELEKQGYQVVDADQWGNSYRHQHRMNRWAQLDESPDESGWLHLQMREEDLAGPEVERIGDELENLYYQLGGGLPAGDGCRDCPYVQAYGQTIWPAPGIYQDDPRR
jgi:hypothetical protein